MARSRINENDVRAAMEGIPPDMKVISFIRAATALTAKVEAADAAGLQLLTTDLLKEIEVQLACHFAEPKVKQHQSRSTGKSSSTYQGQWGQKLSRTSHGQNALTLDISGYLAKIDRGITQVGMLWLGTDSSLTQDSL